MDLLSAADPFAVVSCGEDEFSTEVISNSNAPNWDEEFHFRCYGQGVLLKLFLYDHDVGGTTSAAAEKDNARAAARRALLAETAAAEAAELASELEAASERAARMRIDGEASGSRLAAIELGPFQLPNPGGGADLLDDAVLTLEQLTGEASALSQIRSTGVGIALMSFLVCVPLKISMKQTGFSRLPQRTQKVSHSIWYSRKKDRGRSHSLLCQASP